MTKPDEALLYAREQIAARFETWGDDDGDRLAIMARQGQLDSDCERGAEAYRAGQAAAAEQLKASREAFLIASGRVGVLQSFLKRLREWDQMNPPMTGDHGAFAATIDRLLKEADQ